LIRPDDAIGGKLLLCLPSTVVHEIDAWSPLAPPPKAGDCDAFCDTAAYSYKWPSSRQRLDDSTSNNRPAFFCIACGEAYASEAVLRRHTSSTAACEAADQDGEVMCLACGDTFEWHDKLMAHFESEHPNQRFEQMAYNKHWIKGQTYNHANIYDCRGCRQDGFTQAGPHKYTREEIHEWLTRAKPELIAIVGAVDTATGSNFETQHSYTLDDIEWDAQHKPCVYPDKETQVATVDFKAFLETIDAAPVPIGGLADGIQFHL
jgi:hypothetical protein